MHLCSAFFVPGRSLDFPPDINSSTSFLVPVPGDSCSRGSLNQKSDMFIVQHWMIKTEFNFSYVPGVSPDSKVDSDPGGETNKIISKLACVLLLLCHSLGFPVSYFVFLCHILCFPCHILCFRVIFSAAWHGLFQVTAWMLPIWRWQHLRRFL